MEDHIENMSLSQVFGLMDEGDNRMNNLEKNGIIIMGRS